ncbi:MAG: antibiotic biosynthesis monooxygenase [Acidobacteria bacterium]|jgi:quinol monooxygenase YgiN|nr:antibiotic biosynthesis monooxygenase [Acidobacteriota bacterium]
MFVVAAQYYAKEGKAEEIAAILETMIPISRSESGCALYTVNRSVDDPRKFLLYEQYHDRSGYEAHMATDAFKENILGRVVPMLESRVRDFYEVLEPA